MKRPSCSKSPPSLLPGSLEQEQDRKKILKNTGWLLADKIVRMGVGLLTGIWIARHLGPEQFGLLNYAVALVSIYFAMSGLGLNGIVVRDLVRNPERSDHILGTAFLLQAMGSLLCLFLTIATIGWLRPENSLVQMMVLVLSIGSIFRVTEVVKYWFESKVQSSHVVWVENGTFLVLSAVKIALVLNGASVMAFAWVGFCEALLISIGLTIAYAADRRRLFDWKPDARLAKAMLKDAWPLALAGIAVTIYMKIDQIMLGEMAGSDAVGLYTAATRISEAWYFIPMALSASMSPSILESRTCAPSLYREKIQHLLDLMALLSISIAALASFFSEEIIQLLYGQAYQESATILSIHAWTGVFVFSGVASSQWLLAENMQIYSFYRTLAGCISNVLLNLYLIPSHGMLGAAWATLISTLVAALLFSAAHPKMRTILTMQLRSLLLLNIIGRTRKDST